MPSSNKTGHLRLNSWLGSDKPKKDDFNSDNRLIDAACKELDGRVAAAQGAKATVDAHVADAASHMLEGERTVWQGHLADMVAHVTAAERAAWGAGGAGGGNIRVGSYVGDGNGTRSIPLGYSVRFGVLFGVGVGIADADLVNAESRMYAGFLSSSGCSKNIILMTDGFTVVHTVAKPMDGLCYRYNETGMTYVYVLWPEN